MIRIFGEALVGSEHWSWAAGGVIRTVGASATGTATNYYVASGGLTLLFKGRAYDYPRFDGSLKVFRVEGKCVQQDCEATSLGDDSCANAFTTVINVFAANPKDVCAELKRRGFRFPIKTISLFSRSPFESAAQQCNQLIDVTPMIEELQQDPDFCTECCELLLDDSLSAGSAVSVVAMAALSYTVTGSKVLTLSNPSTPAQFSFPGGGIGNILLGGEAVAQASDNGFISTDGVVLSGFALAGTEINYYESVGGLVTGGMAELTEYRVTTTGGFLISGSADSQPRLRYVSGGAVVTYGESTVRGEAFAFPWTPTGGVVLGEAAVLGVNHVEVTPEGGLTLSPLVAPVGANHVNFVASGGLNFINGYGAALAAVGSGGVSAGGSAPAETSVSFEGAGLVALSGTAIVVGQHPFYNGSGLILTSGSADVSSSDIGSYTVGAKGSAEVTVIGLLFAEDPVTRVAADIDTVSLSDCCTQEMPVLLELRHDLLRVDAVAKFLKRNGLKLLGDLDDPRQSYVKMNYRSRTRSWQGNVHLRGLSPIAPQQQAWSFLFELACTQTFGTNNYNVNVWRFTLQIVQKNLTTQDDFLTKLSLAFEQDVFCPMTNTFSGLDFEFNTQTHESVPADMQEAVFFDDVRMFKDGVSFRKNPVLHISIRVPGLDVTEMSAIETNLDAPYNATRFVLQGV